MRAAPSSETGPALTPTAAGAWRVLFVLTIVMAISYADRFALAILLIPIKQELQLSDTEIGLLTGLAFSLFYAMCSLPIARLADRGSRKAILIGSVGRLEPDDRHDRGGDECLANCSSRALASAPAKPVACRRPIR